MACPLLDGGRQVEASFKVETPKECLLYVLSSLDIQPLNARQVCSPKRRALVIQWHSAMSRKNADLNCNAVQA